MVSAFVEVKPPVKSGKNEVGGLIFIDLPRKVGFSLEHDFFPGSCAFTFYLPKFGFRNCKKSLPTKLFNQRLCTWPV